SRVMEKAVSTMPQIEKIPTPEVDIQPVLSLKATYDVCVFGATSAGIIAAYTAAKNGKSVLIVATGDHLGGLSSGGLGQTDIGNKHVVKGLSRDFYRQLGRVYGALEAWQFEPKEASKIFRTYMKEANIDYIAHFMIHQVLKEGGKITSLDVRSQKNNAIHKISSKVYIDASYEGDLMAAAGVSFTIGREGNQKYGETYNGVYLPKYRAESSGYHQFPDNISPYKVSNDPGSGLVFGVQDNALAERGAGDKLTQAYNFRITLTDSVENQIPITRPANYDSTRYELLVRLFEAQPELREINNYFIWSKMPNRKTDINNRGAFSTDYIGANHDYPLASPEERRKIFEDHLTYTQGLLYFYATDPRVPEQLQEYVKKWGYPKDEFVDNNHFTPQLYVREARRMVGEYVMTEHNCLGKEIVQDGIAYAAYTMDSHNTQRIVVNGMVKNEGNVEIGGFSPYPISYRSLVPQRQEVTNLIVPVCMSASHIAYGSIRMEPVFMLLGQVAGLAAVESIQNNQIIQEVDYRAINRNMENDPYLQHGFKDIVIDNKGLPAVNTADWTKKEHKIYYSNDLAVSKDLKSLQVDVTNVKAAKYKLYYFVPVVSEIYNDPYYTFSFEGQKVEVNLMDYLNDWLLLGEIDLRKNSSISVTIENDNHIVYDAVQLVPVIE
ncbi:MAG TPA: FAD-dependent oxidoreductase, partial [Sphingobacterium sp.]|nr:FAD-dependent oxidoreductase [Sphingobacterium sp.]